MYISQTTIHKLIPFAVAFDVSVAVAVFGHYIDPTLTIIGAGSCAITTAVMAVIWFRNI